jgi:hypothetical protein
VEELFRFSVIRPVGKATPVVTSVGASQAAIKKGAASFVLQVTTQIASLLATQISGTEVWSRLEPIAADYLVASGATILNDPMWAALNALLKGLQVLYADSATAAVDAAAIDAVFAVHPTVTAAAVDTYRAEIDSVFLALLIVRRAGPAALEALCQQPNYRAIMQLLAREPTLQTVAATIAACDIFTKGAVGLAPAAGLGAVASIAVFEAVILEMINATFLFPPGFVSGLRKPMLGVGFRELQVVKQHIRQYQKAEIGRIENILKGESREHLLRHSLSTETDTTDSETQSTETDKELDTADHTNVQTEAQNQVSTDTKLNAGVQASYSGPSYKIQADLNVSYNNAQSETQQYSTDTAKDVTQKAATKVSDIVTRSQTTKVIEAFLDREKQSFDNTGGSGNISGIYQWIEKVYLCQTFNLGRHMLIDVTIPEPGANLLAMATVTSVEAPPPVQPHPLGTIKMANGVPLLDRWGRQQLDQPLDPLSLGPTRTLVNGQSDPNFYGVWVGLYGATGVTPPPVNQKTFSKPVSFSYKDDNDPMGGDQVVVDDGYAATSVIVTITAMRNDNPAGGVSATTVYVNVSVAGQVVQLPWEDQLRTDTLSAAVNLMKPATGTVPFTIYGHNIDQMDVNVELVATCLPATVDQWRLQTYEKIVAAYQTLEQNYETALTAQKLTATTVGPLGSEDPNANLLTALVEVKRACIAILSNDPATVRGLATPVAIYPPNPPAPQAPPPLDPDNPQLPEPVVAQSQIYGAWVRWFEQAFEWENVAYVLYPYYWGRRSQWVPGLELENTDPQFLSFLQAGYARAVVPVRQGFAKAVQFYLHTGLPWLGDELPLVGDTTQNPLYLDVAEEIKALTGGGEEGETETPIGDPWDYVLPTVLMQLQDSDSLPEWHRVVPAGESGPAYASDAPDDAWTWADGAPT